MNKATPKSSPKCDSNTVSHNNAVTPKQPDKLERVVDYLATGQSLNRFEAEKVVNDHCLHSTMSAIKNKHDIEYQTASETVPGWGGSPTRVSRYWLDEEGQAKALILVAHMRKRRGLITLEVA